MRRALLLILTSYILLPLAARAQDFTTCPVTGDLNSSRVICTSGPFANPYLDTGIVSNLHSIQSPYVRLGHGTVNAIGFGASLTWIYQVDTNITHILLVRDIVNIASVGETPADSLTYSMIEILDSTGQQVGDSCYQIRFTYHDRHGTTTTAANGNVTYSAPNRYYAFDLRPFHGQTLSIRFTAGKPPGLNTRCMSRIQFSCIRVDSITSQYSCYQGYTHTAPDGFIYTWVHNSNPDSVLSNSRTFVPHDLREYSCHLFSYAMPDTSCYVATLSTKPITFSESTGRLDLIPVDTIEADTVCRVQFRLRKDFSSTLYTPVGDTTFTLHDPSVPNYCEFHGNQLSASDTLFTLNPGSHTFTMYYLRTEGCTNTVTKTVTVSRLACHYYDSLYSSCPSVYDLGNLRTHCTYGTWRENNPMTESIGTMVGRHTLITTPGTDANTGGLLSVIPPGENASIKLGNDLSGSEYESITFYYKVDTTQSDLLILRYAAVLENPSHYEQQQPKFTFEILDSSGAPINSDCYSATYVASTSLGWNAIGSSSNILWKDWTTIGADLSGVHGQVVSIRLTTYDCSQGAHFGYAYFTLGCHQRQIQAIHCLDTSYYSAPDGFTYQWYPDGQPGNIVATTRDYSTTSRERFHCRLGFIGAPAGTNCHTLISTSPPIPQYPVSAFSIDTLDTIGCFVRLRLVNHSSIVTEVRPDSLATEPCSNWQFLVDTLPPVANTDTIIIDLGPGSHTLRLATAMTGRPCTDTLTLNFLASHICRYYDTLTICPEQLPVVIDDSIIYGDTTLYLDHGDTLLVLTVIVGQQTDITIFDTIVENQLPWNFLSLTIADTVGIDTLLILPGTAPECDTHLHYILHVWPNMTDSAFLYLCPSMIPYSIAGLALSGDTTVVYTGQHGEDSTVHYHIYNLADSDTTIHDTILEKQLPWAFLDSLFSAASFAAAADTLQASFILVNEQGCDSLIHYTLHIHWDGDHCDTTLTFPTLVTPNADGINDRFVIGGLLDNNCFKFNDLLIYDRTGQLVFHAHNIATEDDWWDPAAQRAPDATYFYVFKAHGVTIHTMHQGVIEVLR